MDGDKLLVSYVLPIASHSSQVRALSGYLRRLSRIVGEVIVVDGSPTNVFTEHALGWLPYVRHLRPELQTINGKVAGVMTGVRAARHDHVIIADDDVRYRHAGIVRMLELLDDHEVVRPQNIFRPLPWHARWDTARSLLNRLSGGDWPGTLGVRRSVLRAAGGYSASSMSSSAAGAGESSAPSSADPDGTGATATFTIEWRITRSPAMYPRSSSPQIMFGEYSFVSSVATAS